MTETRSNRPEMRQRNFFSKMLGKSSASSGNFRRAMKSVLEAFLKVFYTEHVTGIKSYSHGIAWVGRNL